MTLYKVRIRDFRNAELLAIVVSALELDESFPRANEGPKLARRLKEYDLPPLPEELEQLDDDPTQTEIP
jgi:hypothetical protein